MSNHVRHYQPTDPRAGPQLGGSWLGTAGDAVAGVATAVGGLASMGLPFSHR